MPAIIHGGRARSDTDAEALGRPSLRGQVPGCGRQRALHDNASFEEEQQVTGQDFTYLVPSSVEEAIGFRCDFGNKSKFISGGTEVVPMMTRGTFKEACLIELSRIAELNEIAGHRHCHHIGASVTLSRLQRSALVADYWIALAEAAASIREPQVRNRGTIGGNVSHGVPSADLVPALLIFDAQVGLAGRSGRRWLPLSDFLIGPYRTALQADELVAEVKLPEPDWRRGSAFQKLTKFGGSGLSVATTAAAVNMADGRISHARVAIGSAGPVPCRVSAAEEFLIGKAPTEEVLAEAGQMASDAAEPRDGSIRATPAHRHRVLKTLATRAIALAAARSVERKTGAST